MRISMSLPKELLKDFDEVLNDRGYQSRSKGIRDALKDYINRNQWMKNVEGERIGILTIIFEYNKKGILENLTEIQYKFKEDIINSVLHVHLNEKHHLEVVIMKGNVKNIRNLSEKVKKLNGVNHVNLTTSKLKQE